MMMKEEVYKKIKTTMEVINDIRDDFNLQFDELTDCIN